MELLNLKPRNQRYLYNYNNLFLKFTSLYKEKKLPRKMLFSGPKGIGKATFAYHLINYIFSRTENFAYDVNSFQVNEANKSYNLVLNNTHPNFHLIDLLDNKNVIEISQIREMINYSNKSSLNNKEKIILIDNVEKLNLNSSNALLKIVEEPTNNTFFILIFNNNQNIIKTIKSRCTKFNFYFNFDQCIDVCNNIIGEDIFNSVSKDLINHYSTVGDLVKLKVFSSTLNFDISTISLKNFLVYIINNKIYSKDAFIKLNIYKYIEFYLIKLLSIKKSRKQIFLLYESFIKKINNIKEFNLDDESFFIELKTKILNE